MGILETPEVHASPVAAKRKSTDFAKLGPLNKFGTVGFSTYRENTKPAKKVSKSNDPDAMDSDPDDDERPSKDVVETDAPDRNGDLLSPEDARRQGELADGVKKIKVR